MDDKNIKIYRPYKNLGDPELIEEYIKTSSDRGILYWTLFAGVLIELAYNYFKVAFWLSMVVGVIVVASQFYEKVDKKKLLLKEINLREIKAKLL